MTLSRLYSMTFDFDSVIDRTGTESSKWRKYGGRDVLPLWVADMDFRAPPVVIEALQQRVAHGIFGYGTALPSFTRSVVDYCSRQYNWTVDESWIIPLPGVVTGLNLSAAAFGEKGDAILTCTPIYPRFLSVAANHGQETIAVPLARGSNGRYAFDWPRLKQALTPRTRQFFLCNPHNPVSRAFSRSELEHVAAFCLEHDLVLISDEIHCDLILDEVDHIPVATISPEIAARTVTLMAPSKTYNIPGLVCSFVIIPDLILRQRFVRARAGLVPKVNVLGYTACEAALRHGGPWRQALLQYLRRNRDFVADCLAAELPGVTMTPCEATYLAWLDVSALELEQPDRTFEQHGVGLDDGRQYGAPAGKFVRLNFGCPHSILAKALLRMKQAVAPCCR